MPSTIDHDVREPVLKRQISRQCLLSTPKSSVRRRKLITTARKYKQALQDSESRFHQMADRIAEGLWVRDAKSLKCLYVNPSFQAIWGRTLEEMNADEWINTIHPEDQRQASEIFNSHRNGREDFTNTYRIVRPDGSIRWIKNQTYPTFDETGKIVRTSGISRDITEKKKLEEELILAQKLGSLGQISSGIAHEINTPSQYVSDNISFITGAVTEFKKLLQEIPKLLEMARKSGDMTNDIERIQNLYENNDIEFLLEEIPAALNQAQSGMEQIKQTIMAMKEFSHPGDRRVATDLNETISTTLIVARNEWRYVAELITDFDIALPPVHCIPSAINQVILNLVVNAAHAIAEVIKEGELGKIRVSTAVEGDQAIIKIADTGPGIPKDLCNKIFDSSFTTKPVGKGTGQGLAIAQRVIHEDHSGSITVDSILGEGTCFTISLSIKPPNE